MMNFAKIVVGLSAAVVAATAFADGCSLDNISQPLTVAPPDSASLYSRGTATFQQPNTYPPMHRVAIVGAGHGSGNIEVFDGNPDDATSSLLGSGVGVIDGTAPPGFEPTVLSLKIEPVLDDSGFTCTQAGTALNCTVGIGTPDAHCAVNGVYQGSESFYVVFSALGKIDQAWFNPDRFSSTDPDLAGSVDPNGSLGIKGNGMAEATYHTTLSWSTAESGSVPY